MSVATSDDLHRIKDSRVWFVCISLVRESARRRLMSEQFARLGLDVEFFDGIEPDPTRYTETPGYDGEFRMRYYGRHLTRGEVGCYLSHLTVWRQLIARHEGFVCVMEDDVLLDPGFLDAVQRLVQGPDDWDIVRLAGVFDRSASRRIRRLESGLELHDFLHPHRGMQAYIVRREAAEALAHYAMSMRYPVDDALDRYWEHGLRLRAVKPWVAREAGLPTTIEDRGVRVSLPRRVRLRREMHRLSGDARRVACFAGSAIASLWQRARSGRPTGQ